MTYKESTKELEGGSCSLHLRTGCQRKGEGRQREEKRREEKRREEKRKVKKGKKGEERREKKKRERRGKDRKAKEGESMIHNVKVVRLSPGMWYALITASIYELQDLYLESIVVFFFFFLSLSSFFFLKDSNLRIRQRAE